ncbi:thiamine diphosphokinase [Youngiibacter fragilis]|uniref:Thiamine diphosphokinase n=1 Tax=Youngiibacter fragilis 232.1 TaxID=994573 RepID=V7I9Q5_9CLOT|nr:thiamine diphosphokinase [Youngiibacter fragilis]ETA82036.1 thiamine pyrophosphokinase [Youngiibacter fragilis 232.1]
MKAIIVSGGESPKRELFTSYVEPGDVIIAADSGGEFLKEIGIMPDVLLGDFDSLSEETLEYLKGRCEIIRFDAVKDFTDTEAAYLKAREYSPESYLFFGCTGVRLDHFLGNLGLLEEALSEGKEAFIIDGYNKIGLMNRPGVITRDFGDFISFQAFRGDVEGFTIKGARYPLHDYRLRMGDPRTVSNEFVGDTMEVSFKSGIVIVMKSRD